jgi:hypothetical protein
VFEVEPLPADSPLRRMDNVLLTPHCAGGSTEAVVAMANRASTTSWRSAIVAPRWKGWSIPRCSPAAFPDERWRQLSRQGVVPHPGAFQLGGRQVRRLTRVHG